MRGDTHLPLGSALRFFEPLSGFLAGPCFAALFHAATVPGILPSELSPRRDRVSLSRPLAPLQLSTDVLKRAGWGLVVASFTDFHAFTQLPGSPADYELPFHEPKLAFRLLWTLINGVASFGQLSLLRSFVPSTNPFSTTSSCP